MTAAALQLLFPCSVWCPDTTYAEPTLRWLQGAFWQSFRADRWAKVGSYSRKNDCDNWARAYAQHAQDCHAMSHGSEAEALAVGEMFYTKASGEGHAICVAITEQGLVFLEPQNGQVITLSPSEILSCFFVRF